MRLYHTGSVEIKSPDIFLGRKNADFGQGFYLTPDEDFTIRWAAKDAVINEYELDLTGLEVKRFVRDKEWFDYIFENRRVNDTIKADVVIGPIANDTIYDTLGIISSGFLSPKKAVDLLMIGPEYIQVVIKSEKAREQLSFLGSRRAAENKEQEEALKKEQEEYLSKFAEAMEKL